MAGVRDFGGESSWNFHREFSPCQLSHSPEHSARRAALTWVPALHSMAHGTRAQITSSEQVMTESSRPMNRRSFLGSSAALIAGSTLLPRTAASYEKILGANDRISLGHIGTGHRGDDLDLIVSKLQSSHHAEMTAVCDLWKSIAKRPSPQTSKYYGRAPRAFQYMEELLALKDVDARDHLHAPTFRTRPCSKWRPRPARMPTAKSPWPTSWKRPRPRAMPCCARKHDRADRHAASQRALPDRRHAS